MILGKIGTGKIGTAPIFVITLIVNKEKQEVKDDTD